MNWHEARERFPYTTPSDVYRWQQLDSLVAWCTQQWGAPGTTWWISAAHWGLQPMFATQLQLIEFEMCWA